MTSFRFVHAADLHIDSPLRGLEADPDAPADRIRTATRAAYTNLVDLALREQVAFVLIAGDLFDGEWQDWRTGQFFAQETARLTRAGIRVFCIRGNHDAASVVTGRLALPDGARMLPTDQPAVDPPGRPQRRHPRHGLFAPAASPRTSCRAIRRRWPAT